MLQFKVVFLQNVMRKQSWIHALPIQHRKISQEYQKQLWEAQIKPFALNFVISIDKVLIKVSLASPAAGGKIKKSIK